MPHQPDIVEVLTWVLSQAVDIADGQCRGGLASDDASRVLRDLMAMRDLILELSRGVTSPMLVLCEKDLTRLREIYVG